MCTRGNNSRFARRPPWLTQSWRLAAQVLIPVQYYAPGSPRVCQQKSTRVIRYVCRTIAGILQTRDHGPAPSYECGNAWSRLVLSPSYECGNAWSLVPATNMGTRSRPWHTSPQLIVPHHMQFSRTPATIGHDGCSLAAMPGRSPDKSTRQVYPTSLPDKSTRQVYPTSLKEEPHGLGGRATPQQ